MKHYLYKGQIVAASSKEEAIKVIATKGSDTKTIKNIKDVIIPYLFKIGVTQIQFKSQIKTIYGILKKNINWDLEICVENPKKIKVYIVHDHICFARYEVSDIKDILKLIEFAEAHKKAFDKVDDTVLFKDYGKVPQFAKEMKNNKKLLPKNAKKITASSKEEAIKVIADSKPITVKYINSRNYKEYIGKYVNVTGDVDLSELGLKELPIKFGKVDGDFDCCGNKLTSLNGAPKSVGGYFLCSYNKLTSLDGAPKSVGGDFNCSRNELTSLSGAPKSVGNFYCHYNKLTSLDDAPKSVGGNFYCSENKLTSLDGAPKSVSGYFDCCGNKLTSLKGAPKSVGGYFLCSYNKLTSLDGAPKSVGGDFDCYHNKKKFTVEDVKKVSNVISGIKL